MKYITIIVLSMFIALSCGGDKKSSDSNEKDPKKSKKGSWTKKDMQKCIKESQSEMDEEALKMFEMLDEDVDEMMKCMCEQLEERYRSFNAADLSVEEDISERESMIMVMDCVSETTRNIIKMGMEGEQGGF